MNDQAKTKEELITELEQLRQQVAALQSSEIQAGVANGNGVAYVNAVGLTRLSSAVDFLRVGLTISDPNQPDNPLVFVNQGFTYITGYSAEDVIGRNCRFLQGNGTDQKVVREIREALAEKRSCHVKLLNYRKDGTPFWNELSLQPIFDEEGELLNFVGLQTDVTVREQFQQELAQTEAQLVVREEQLERVIAHTAVILFALNKEGVFTLSEGQGLSRLGLRPGDIVGQSVFELYANYPEMIRAARRALAGEQARVMIRMNGVVFDVFYEPLWGSNGVEIEGVAGVAHDVTLLKQAEARLSHRVEFEQLLNQMATQFVSTPPDFLAQNFEATLLAIGKFLALDRLYVGVIQSESHLVQIEYEWCALGVSSYRKQWSGQPLLATPWLAGQLYTFNAVRVAQTAQMPPAAKVEQIQAEGRGTLSFAIVPMTLNNRLMGFVGLESVRQERQWSDEDITLIDLAGIIFVGAMERKRAYDELLYRIRYEQGMGSAAQLLASRQEGVLDEALEALRYAIQIQRVYVYENQVSEDGVLTAHCIAHAELDTAAASLPYYPSLPYEQAGLTRWRYLLNQDQIIQGAFRSLSPQEQIWLNRDEGGMVLFPVFVHGRWHGFVGFEHSLDVWPEEMLVLFRSFVQILSAYLEGQQIQAELNATHLLQQRKERHTLALLEAVPDIVIRMNRDGNLLMIQLPAEFREEFPPNQLQGLSLSDVLPPEDMALFKTHITEAFDSGATQQTTYIYQWPNTDVVTAFDVRLTPIDEQELVVFARNMTESLANQHELKRANFELAARVRELSALNEMVGLFDRPVELNQTLNDVAKVISELFGVFSTYISLYDHEKQERAIVAGYDPHTEESDRLIGLTFDIRATEYTAPVMRGEIFTIESTSFDKLDENARPIMNTRGARQILIVPLHTLTRVVGVLSLTIVEEQRKFGKDDFIVAQVIAAQVTNALERRRLYETAQQEIAERIVSQQALEQAHNQALNANRIKSQILARVSHELRTPLSVIMGHAELLNKGIYGAITAEQEEVMNEVVGSTRYLAALVNDLLDQASFDREGVSIELEEIDLPTIATQTVNSMKVLAQVKGLDLRVEIAEQMSEPVLGDAKRYQQILFNLLSNAVKYTVEGEVLLLIRPVNKIFWEVCVRDTGIGIPENAQSTIFEPFYQLDVKLTSERLGTGLGLSIVKQLVDRLGGKVFLESQVDVGSQFTVQLPWEPNGDERA